MPARGMQSVASHTRRRSQSMSVSVNRVVLIGTCGKYGLSLKYLPSGSAVANGSITLSESGKNGQQYDSYFPVECFGQKAERASELEPGTPIYLEGRLSKRKIKDGAYEVVVNCYDVQALGQLTVRDV